MITLISSLALLGFYVLYSTSKRAQLTFWYKLQKSINKKPQQGKFIGMGLLLFSLILSIYYLGWGAGTFSFLIIVMTIASLVVLVSPLCFFKLYTLIIIALISFGVELFIP